MYDLRDMPDVAKLVNKYFKAKFRLDLVRITFITKRQPKIHQIYTLKVL
jgi:hypothetical protein